MKIAATYPAQLTYCLNVHPGATPAQLDDAALGRAPVVFEHLRELTGRGGPYGLGLWLSAAVAEHYADAGRLADFRARLARAGLYALTFNGFPFGPFHGQRVKEEVYRPDWTTAERGAHTARLARLLAGLVDPGTRATVSTVPVTYGAWATPAVVQQATAQLARTAFALHRLADTTGVTVQLLLEPEPDCYLQDTATVLHYFPEILWRAGAGTLVTEQGLSRGRAEELLQRYLGICLDTIHLGVAFEEPEPALNAIADRGIAVGKVHLGAALASRHAGPPPPALARFTDAVYLHQTRCRQGRQVTAFSDLPAALAQQPPPQGDWRVHYHVPLVWDGTPELTSTRDALTPAFLAAAVRRGVAHFEVETYTLSVFPDQTEAPERLLARELAWVLERFPA